MGWSGGKKAYGPGIGKLRKHLTVVVGELFD
jgi:hypothetical protein